MARCEDAPCCGCCGYGVFGFNDPAPEPEYNERDYLPADRDDEDYGQHEEFDEREDTFLDSHWESQFEGHFGD